jgi:hypothetical protein
MTRVISVASRRSFESNFLTDYNQDVPKQRSRPHKDGPARKKDRDPLLRSSGGHPVARSGVKGAFYVKVTPKRAAATANERVQQESIDKTIKLAARVLGSRDEAYRWLGTPIRGLDFATPIYVLKTKGGVNIIKDILGQMEHGTW